VSPSAGASAGPTDAQGDYDPIAELQRLEESQFASLEQLRAASSVPVTVAYRIGRPASVTMRVPTAGADAIARARDFMARFGALYLQTGTDVQIHPRFAAAPPSSELETVEFMHTYRGVPVHNSSFRVALDATEVVGTAGTLLAPLELSVEPSIAQVDAVARAQAEGNGRVIGIPRLFVDQRLAADGISRLVWQISFDGARAEAVVVDAHSGEVLSREPLSLEDESDYDFEEFDAQYESSQYDCFILSGSHIGSEDGLAKSYHGDTDAVNGWLFGKWAYDWYHGNFNRHGFDGDDDQLELFVHADWEEGGRGRWQRFCQLMEFRDGAVQQDIVVHEYTHAVLDNNEWGSGLNYQGQSGALNEAYADVMAILSDPDMDWTLGEDRVGGPIRDFASPGRLDIANPQPSHVDNLFTDAEDHGGVHSNSGIVNNAHYLMTMGGTNPWSKEVVTGFSGGVDAARIKMAHLAWMTMVFLTYDALFQEARDFEVLFATQFAAKGAFGFTAQDVCTVKNAWSAVGVPPGDADCDFDDDSVDDDDGDGILNSVDNCVGHPNASQVDPDGDGTGLPCDPDDDNDAVGDADDNCPYVGNPDQADQNQNGWGDTCDSDDDDDHVDDDGDNCLGLHNPDQSDTDGDGAGNRCDGDMDADGIANAGDVCPLHAGVTPDGDADGYGDACDPCPANAFPGSSAFDADGEPKLLDSDSDGISDECDHFTGMLDPSTAQDRFKVVLGGVCPPECEYEVPPEELGSEWMTNVALTGIEGGVAVWITDDMGIMVAKSTCSNVGPPLEPPVGIGLPGDFGGVPNQGVLRSCSGPGDVNLSFHPRVGKGYVLNFGVTPDGPPVALAYQLDVTEGPSDPLDPDADGLTGESDNCARVPNADQLDGDADGVGDACDPAPDASASPTPTVTPPPSPTASPEPSETPTPQPTATPTVSPSARPTPSPTIEPTPPTIDGVRASETTVYWNECTPNSVTFRAQISDDDGLDRVQLRYRYQAKSGAAVTEMFRTPMTESTADPGLWEATVTPDLGDLATELIYDPAFIDIQVVARDDFGATATTGVIEDVATVLNCKP
jgi:Zn-dependent metalloprotease